MSDVISLELADIRKRLRMLESVEVPGSGSFTPTYYGATTAGVTTYTLQSGIYQRNDRTIHFSLRLIWTNATGTGFAVVGGFPFASNASFAGTFPVMPLNHDFTQSGMIAFMYGSATTMQFISPVSGSVANVAIDVAGELVVTGHYFL